MTFFNSYVRSAARISHTRVLLAIVLSSVAYLYCQQCESSDETISSSGDLTVVPTRDHDEEELDEKPRTIKDIVVTGNKLVPTNAILDRVPYKKSELFDPLLSGTAIRNLYNLKRFRNIQIFVECVSPDELIVYIEVEEKKPLKDLIIVGNKQIASKEINKALNTSELSMIDPEELSIFAGIIKKTYADKGYHRTEVIPEIVIDDENRATVTLTIQEKKKAIVKRIQFTGNHSITAKKLRNAMLTHEDWLLGLMDKSGTFLAAMLEGDRYMIEQLYQNSGYMNAKVVEIDVAMAPKTDDLTLTYDIQEGDKYTIKTVKVSGNNETLSDEFLTSILPLRPGNTYSRTALIDSIKTLENVWGDFGYLYAHIEPSIEPNDDEKTVDISFFCDIGNPITLDALIIKGNHKTRDRVIRRRISLQEGALITNSAMESSKERIEALGYFDQKDGVSWKTVRTSEKSAELELQVKEVKTGNAHIKLGFGGNPQTNRTQDETKKSPDDDRSDSSTTNSNIILNGLKAEISASDTNLFGSGIRTALTAILSSNEKTGTFNITQPWLFNKPIYGSLDVYYKRISYDQLSLTPVVNERQAGGIGTTGIVINSRHKHFNDTFLRASFAVDSVSYGKDNIEGTNKNRVLHAAIPPLFLDPNNVRRQRATDTYTALLAKIFTPGYFFTLAGNIGRDQRNHPIHPSRGLSWLGRSILGFPALDNKIGFYKCDLDINWFTPLINERDLVLRLHFYAGFIHKFKNHVVPYRELLHVGGPSSVRGWLWGQIGPQFEVIESSRSIRQDSIGASRAAYLNAELIFPVTRDFNFKGVVFYDGGTGWKNPFTNSVPDLNEFVVNQHFHYRHAVGFGIRILNPMPIRVDWGFKLDPHKNESPYEVHFGMTYDW